MAREAGEKVGSVKLGKGPGQSVSVYAFPVEELGVAGVALRGDLEALSMMTTEAAWELSRLITTAHFRALKIPERL